MRRIAWIAIVCFAAPAQSPPRQVTWKGWFADADCGRGRFSTATLTPPNPECVKKCIEKGVAPVFLSEDVRAVYQVKDYPAVVENLGYHLEIAGRADDAAKTISVQSVKRISEYRPASCARPKKKP